MSAGEAGERTALVLGATGLVGGECVDLLLDDPRWSRVVAAGRRPFEREHPRLEQRVVDFDRLSAHAAALRADDVFCCLGTTIRAAGSREAFRRVDHDYVLEAARLALEGGAGRFLLVSAVGADPRSRIFYSRVKGETERDVRALGYRTVAVFRPSLLLGDRGELRSGEKLAEWLAVPISPLMIGPLARFRPVHARAVAAAMVRGAAGFPPGVHTVESEEIRALAGGG
jgi:uncharacterized protein YbjT (DUF2867 family)